MTALHSSAATPVANLRGADRLDRFDRRLAHILAHATDVFCEKGYAGASMRDLSRAAGMSLAGLYYYFESKEKLLYLIQKHTFSTIVEKLRARLDGVADPKERLRTFIQNHLEYFLANQKAMKVLSHEDEALKNQYAQEIAAIKREYYRVCRGLVEDLWRGGRVQSAFRGKSAAAVNSRIAVLSLFGMMNWIYTWHNPRIDANADVLSRQMADIFLKGIGSGERARRKAPPRSTNSSNRSIKKLRNS
jgi:AcrR family transcriptional regulator